VQSLADENARRDGAFRVLVGNPNTVAVFEFRVGLSSFVTAKIVPPAGGDWAKLAETSISVATASVKIAFFIFEVLLYDFRIQACADRNEEGNLQMATNLKNFACRLGASPGNLASILAA
jgi:hypothetical protein